MYGCGSDGEESACNEGDLGSIPGLGRSPGERKDYPFQYSGLENFIDYSPWSCKESDTIERLSFSYRDLTQLKPVLLKDQLYSPDRER